MLWCNAISPSHIVHIIPLCDKLYKFLQSSKVDVNVDKDLAKPPCIGGGVTCYPAHTVVQHFLQSGVKADVDLCKHYKAQMVEWANSCGCCV